MSVINRNTTAFKYRHIRYLTEVFYIHRLGLVREYGPSQEKSMYALHNFISSN